MTADLASASERRRAVDEANGLADGTLAAVVTCAGLAGSPDRKGSLLSSVNYFGTVEVLEGLRPLLAAGGAAVAISSNSTTVQPDIPLALIEGVPRRRRGGGGRGGRRGDVDGRLRGDEDRRRLLGAPARHGPEWAGAGLRLNAVAPGLIETPMVAAMRADERTGPMLDMLPIPLGRPGRPEEIAALVAFLVGPDSTFFCGSVVFCDGGSDALLRTQGLAGGLGHLGCATSPGTPPVRRRRRRSRRLRGCRGGSSSTRRRCGRAATSASSSVGQLVSMLGTQLTVVAIPYQVYSMTHSSLQVGAISLAQLFPFLAGALAAGPIGDAVDRRPIMIWTGVAGAVTSARAGGQRRCAPPLTRSRST